LGFPLEKGGQFFNLITAWDLLRDSGVRPGQWLALTAGYSTVSIMALQFARHKGVNIISVVRRAHEDLDLKTLGAADVIDLSAVPNGVGERVMQVTQNKGINGIVDSVGGPVTGELIRSMAFGGQVIINGGMAAERFELHNFDVLLKGLDIKAHVYRYFFTPPQVSDNDALREITEISGRSSFNVPTGGLHSLEDFEAAIDETMRNPGHGKRLFKMPG
jgi:NADPH:quinone reductase-like Zn-dependent oxidoreductase